ncbi:DUF1007 family protein [Rhodobacteraceae bacterium CCMM004]|nr:DUF1007 family protein [Rhodobacteraceae bacterium CCMM004]
MALALSAAGTGIAAAHPHVFIDTGLTLAFDGDGVLEAVTVEWTYDAFYSLLIVEEARLDGDGDGVPDPEALIDYAGHDVDWEAGFPGDLALTVDGVAATLGPPVDHVALYVDGRIVTRHTRPVTAPAAAPAREILARAYDPTYFVAYDVPEIPRTTGGAVCAAVRDAADRAAAQRAFGDALAALDMPDDPFEPVDIPDIGIHFADTFTLRCAPSA